MIEDVKRTDFYTTVYNKLYAIGYHSDPNYSHAYGLIEAMIEHCEFDSVLDVGASVGAAVEKLNSLGKSAIGLETSFIAMSRANQYGRPCLWGEATRIPFCNKHVDVVMSTDVMEHLRPEDVPEAVYECQRVAKKYIAMKVATQGEMAGWGKKVGVEDLHLTVEPIEKWKERFCRMGDEIIWEAGDSFIVKLRKEENG